MISLALAVPAALMFVAGGVVKGTLGVGLPLLVVPLLTLILPASHLPGHPINTLAHCHIVRPLQDHATAHSPASTPEALPVRLCKLRSGLAVSG